MMPSENREWKTASRYVDAEPNSAVPPGCAAQALLLGLLPITVSGCRSAVAGQSGDRHVTAGEL
jgi:hypothetical protein